MHFQNCSINKKNQSKSVKILEYLLFAGVTVTNSKYSFQQEIHPVFAVNIFRGIYRCIFAREDPRVFARCST